MRNRLLAFIAAPIIILGLSALPASASTHPVTTLKTVAPASVKPADFTGIGQDLQNVKIESWDDGCVTYAHPVAATIVGVVPCNQAHTFDYITSPDATQAVWKIHGANLAVGDAGGVITTKTYNQTSNSLILPASPPGCFFSKNGLTFQGFAFEESNPLVFMQSHGNMSQALTAVTSCNVHTTFVVLNTG